MATESPPDEESWGGDQLFKSWSDSKSPSLGIWLFLVQLVTVPVEHSSDVKQRPKKIKSFPFPFQVTSTLTAKAIVTKAVTVATFEDPGIILSITIQIENQDLAGQVILHTIVPSSIRM